MYPCMTLSHGLRFLEPRETDLGGEGENILIGGRNGAGKSTDALAAALTLGSNMVSVDALRDSGLSPKEPWHAGYTFIFHNPPGRAGRPNADEYIAIQMTISQGPVGKSGVRPAPEITWQILEGPRLGPEDDRMVEFAVKERFTDRNRLVDTVRRRFAIDPDRYAMFWHQTQITRFVDLSDIDKAAEMLATFELEGLEAEWHDARAACRKAWERMKDAEVSCRRNEVELDAARTQYNVWQRKQTETRDSLIKFWSATTAYRQRLEKEEHLKRDLLARLEAEEAELRQRAAAVGQEGTDARTEERRALAEAEAAEAEQHKEHQARQADVNRADELKRHIDQRRNELDGLLRQRSALRSREELATREAAITAEQSTLCVQRDELSLQISDTDQERNSLLAQVGGFQKDEGRLTKEWKAAVEELGALASRSELEREQREWKEAHQQDLKEQVELQQERDAHRKQLEMLSGRTGAIHPAQEASIQRSRGWSLGALLDVAPGIHPEDAEQRLGAIKHSIVTVEPVVAPTAPVYHIALSEEDSLPPLEASSAAGLVVPATSLPADFPAEGSGRIVRWLKTVALVADDAEAESVVARGYLALLPNGTLLDRFGSRGPLANEPAVGPQALVRARKRHEETIRRVERRLGEVDENIETASQELGRINRHLVRRETLEQLEPRLADQLAEIREMLPGMQADITKLNETLSSMRTAAEALSARLAVLDQDQARVHGELAVHAELERVGDRVVELDAWEAEKKTLEQSADGHRRRATECEQQAELQRQEAKSWGQIAEEAERKQYQLLSEAESRVRDRTNTQSRLIRVAELLTEEQSGRNIVWGDHGPLISTLNPEPKPVWLEPTFALEELRAEIADARHALSLAESINVPDDADQIYTARAAAHKQRMEDFVGATSTYNELRLEEKEYRDRFRNAVQGYHLAVDRQFRAFLEKVGMHGHILLVPPPQMDDSDEDGRPAPLGRGGYQWQIWAATVDRSPDLVPPHTSRTRTKNGEGPSGGERSAISLIHALAMLTTLEVRPCFYWMDEFDSALDETNKRVLFDLYCQTLGRKIITVSPKAAAKDYLERFARYYCYLRREDGRAEAVSVSLDRYAEVAKQVRKEEGDA